MRKLGFLKRVMCRNTDSLSGCVVLVLCNEVDSICLVRECRRLEESFGTCFTEAILLLYIQHTNTRSSKDT